MQRLNLQPEFATLRDEEPTATFTAQVLGPGGEPVANELVRITLSPSTELPIRCDVVIGKLVDRPEPTAVIVLTNEMGQAAIRVELKGIPTEQENMAVTAETEPGEFDRERAHALLLILPPATHSGLTSSAPKQPAGMPCPQCGHLIEFSVEELLRRCFFRCMHCGLELRLNG